MDSRWSDQLQLGYCPSLDHASQLAVDRSPLGRTGRGTSGVVNLLSCGQRGAFFNGSSYVTFPHEEIYSTPIVSVSCWAFSGSASGSGVITKDNASTAPRSWFLDTSGGWRWVIVNPSYGANVATATLDNNVWAHLVCTFDNATLRIYKNGILAASSSLAGPCWNNTRPITIGGFEGSGSFNGAIDDVQVRGRVLTANEAAELYRLGPGGIYRTRRKVFYAKVPSVSTAVAISGEVTITGSNSAALTSNTAAAEVGTVTITGSNATVLTSNTAAAEAGTVTITGSDAAALTSNTVAAEAGSVTITGSDASALISNTVAAQLGTVTITGSDAAALSASIAAAVAGEVTITGSDAVALISNTAVAAAGEVTITGSDATAFVTSTATATVGNVTITGSDAVGLTGSTAVAVVGTVTITGSNAIPLAASTAVAVVGTVTITGSDAVVLSASTAVALVGTVTITGSDAVASGQMIVIGRWPVTMQGLDNAPIICSGVLSRPLVVRGVNSTSTELLGETNR